MQSQCGAGRVGCSTLGARSLRLVWARGSEPRPQRPSLLRARPPTFVFVTKCGRSHLPSAGAPGEGLRQASVVGPVRAPGFLADAPLPGGQSYRSALADAVQAARPALVSALGIPGWDWDPRPRRAFCSQDSPLASEPTTHERRAPSPPHACPSRASAGCSRRPRA